MNTMQGHLSQRQSTRQPPRPPRRTPMACVKCRQRKVKCAPSDNHLDRRCLRCARRNLRCTYVPISEQETSTPRTPPPGDPTVQEGRGADMAGAPGDMPSLVLIHPSGANINPPSSEYTDDPYREPTYPWTTSYDHTSRADSIEGAYPHERNFQLQMPSTHGGRTTPPNSHASNSWFGHSDPPSYQHQPRDTLTASGSFDMHNSAAGATLYANPMAEAYNAGYTVDYGTHPQGNGRFQVTPDYGYGSQRG